MGDSQTIPVVSRQALSRQLTQWLGPAAGMPSAPEYGTHCPADELPVCSTVWQAIERSNEISNCPTCGEEVFSEKPKALGWELPQRWISTCPLTVSETTLVFSAWHYVTWPR